MISKKLVIQGEEFLIDGKHLGSGTQGSVFQILHLGSGIVYAVKIVNVQNKNALETMEHEINILKNIRSPYVISILPFSIVSERYSYMVMDYCEGGDLKEHYKRLMLGKIPVDEKRVKKLIHDCAQGYKALQANKILHMDIKMENILVKKGNYALADFGLAVNKTQNLTKVGGTLLYFSPARFTKKPNQVNASDDMFALGIVVCQFANKLYHPYYTAKMFNQPQAPKAVTLEFLWKNLKQAKASVSEAYSQPLRLLMMRMIAKIEKERLTWQELYEQVDNGPVFADIRAESEMSQVKIVMPQIINSGSFTAYKDVRMSCVNTNLLNSQYDMSETKQVEKIYVEIKHYIQNKLQICKFLMRLIDIIELYNYNTKTYDLFRKVEESLLSIMEQLVELENLKELNLPKIQNAPERIQIQIGKIREQFQTILSIKNKINCFRDHLKIENFFNAIMSSFENQVHQFEQKSKNIYHQIQIIAGMKQIKEDFTLNSALFKLILYLIEQTKTLLNEKDLRTQVELIPNLFDLEHKDFGNGALKKKVSDFIQNQGFVITFVEDNLCHQILDESQDEVELIQINRMGKYPPIY